MRVVFDVGYKDVSNVIVRYPVYIVMRESFPTAPILDEMENVI